MAFGDFRVRRLKGEEALALVEALASVLIDCVEGGASVSFMAPLGRDKASAFWRRVAEDVENGERALVVAEEASGDVIGTAQAIFSLPENQPHRADIAKMLVKRAARGRGVGAALLEAVEAAALEAGRTLLVLDTASDAAERLYQRGGWVRVGAVPDYALLPQGGLCATTFFYKRLG